MTDFLTRPQEDKEERGEGGKKGGEKSAAKGFNWRNISTTNRLCPYSPRGLVLDIIYGM